MTRVRAAATLMLFFAYPAALAGGLAFLLYRTVSPGMALFWGGITYGLFNALYSAAAEQEWSDRHRVVVAVSRILVIVGFGLAVFGCVVSVERRCHVIEMVPGVDVCLEDYETPSIRERYGP